MQRLTLTIAMLVLAVSSQSIDAATKIEVSKGKTSLEIHIEGRRFATFVFADKKTPRPYFANVDAPGGHRATRNHPVKPGDDQDHPHHTGVFFTFGDLNGVDFWHMRGAVEHIVFLKPPTVKGGQLNFTIESRYMSPDGKTVFCHEVCRNTVRVTKFGYAIDYDITLTPKDKPMVIGSKEEGGIAVRVATPIAVSAGKQGRLIDNAGRVNGKSIWGQQADWVDYSGQVEGQHVGVTVMTAPSNFSRCWWHARDYGLFAANPFGPLNKKGQQKIVKGGEALRLQYTVLFHTTKTRNDFDPQAAYKALVLTSQKK